MHTITANLYRRISLIGALTLLSTTLAACGQPQTSDGTGDAAAQTSATALTVAQATATTATTAPTATSMPSATAVPTEQPTEQPTPDVTAEASSMAHQHTASDPAMAAQPGGVEVQATIKLFMFDPEPLEVKAGATVVWTNEDNIEHSVTSGTPPTPDGTFDSELFTQGKTYAFTFSEPGAYAYFCKRHPSMVGTVNVTP